jgi:hypothetical protein
MIGIIPCVDLVIQQPSVQATIASPPEGPSFSSGDRCRASDARSARHVILTLVP